MTHEYKNRNQFGHNRRNFGDFIANQQESTYFPAIVLASIGLGFYLFPALASLVLTTICFILAAVYAYFVYKFRDFSATMQQELKFRGDEQSMDWHQPNLRNFSLFVVRRF